MVISEVNGGPAASPKGAPARIVCCDAAFRKFSNPLELELHVERSRDRVHAIWRNRAKSQGTVEGDRRIHPRHRVEPHALVPALARGFNDRRGQEAARARSSMGRANVEPLHFANARGIERAQGDAPGNLAGGVRQDDAARRRRVGARETFELMREVLESQIKLERCRVLLEERANGEEIIRKRRVADLDHVSIVA